MGLRTVLCASLLGLLLVLLRAESSENEIHLLGVDAL